MSTRVTISETTAGIAALEQEKLQLFAESEDIAQAQAGLLKQIKDNSKRHNAVLRRIIALEEAQEALLRTS